jgi:hypothetical protein
MKYVNANPVSPMSGAAPRPAPPAVTTVSPVLSKSIGAAVNMPSRHAMSGCGCLPHDATEGSQLAKSAAAELAEHPTRGDAPEAPTPKRGTLPVAYPDVPNSITGTAPGSSIPVATLEKDAQDALRAKGVSRP